MELQKKTARTEPQVNETDSPEETLPKRDNLQQSAQRLTAAREVINRTLSQNSDTFLRQSKQRGGQ